jgi:CheY-like chemotaxis protein
VRLGPSGAGPNRGRRPTGPHRTSRPSQPPVTVPPPAIRILVVDDSRSVREAVSRLLTGGGYTVDTAADGLEAFDLATEVAYDLVITDLEMPRLDGYGLMARLRASQATAAIPILVISSRADDQHREQARNAGATAYLAKPVTKDSLAQALAALLQT